jgi:hypothetical protein
MTHNSLQPTTRLSQQVSSYGPQWEGYDLHQGSHSESQMFPQQQFPGHGLTSAGALRVPARPLQYNPVNRPTSFNSAPPLATSFGVPGRPPSSIQGIDSCRLWNHNKPISQRLCTCTQCQRYPIMSIMQMMRATIWWTCVVQKINHLSA